MSGSEDEEAVPEYVSVGGLRVWPWSLSGVESNIVVVGDHFSVAFDMGYATTNSVRCKNVFISHGHMDHIAGIVHHASKRALSSMSPATYHVPPHLVDNVKALARVFCDLHGDREVIGNINVQPIEPGNTAEINGHTFVQAFPTIHRVPSQGYIVYHKKKSLKLEYMGMDSPEIRQLIQDNVDVHTEEQIPLVAYTGDTMIELFKEPPTPDLLKVKLLITEATYIDDKVKKCTTAVERARDYGHIHLQELIDNRHLFDSVDDILLVHFSVKYSVPYIKRKVKAMMGDCPDFYKKIHLGLQMKAKFP